MKRTYVRPTMVGERFVANEYVAACGEGGTVYELNVMHQRECYIIIQTLMEKLMESTRETVCLRAGSYHRVVQSIKQMLRMIFMMDL